MTTFDGETWRCRRRARGAAFASLVGSLAVHAAFAAAAGGVAWQLAGNSRRAGPPVVIHFEEPGLGEPAEGAPSPARAAAATAAPRREQAAIQATALAALPAAAPALPDDHAGPADTLPPSLLANATSPWVAPADPARSAGNAPAADASIATVEGGVRFAGLGASNARRVVYVVDASGPMVTSLPRVLAELRRSVDQLSPQQKFGVVLFRSTDEGAAIVSFSPVPMRATPTIKQRLGEWLAQVEPRGASSPLAGLEAALAMKPDAVFLLSRSIPRSGGGVWELGIEATLARLDQLNPASRTAAPGTRRRPALIQTIQFLDDDPTGIMQAIGAQHGQGSGYRVVRRGEDIAGHAR